MLQLRGSSSVSVISWASSILLDPHALPTSGRSVCLLPSWLIPSNIRQLRFTFLLFGHFIFTPRVSRPSAELPLFITCCLWDQTLTGHPLDKPFAYHPQPHVGDLEIPGPTYPRSLHVLGGMHSGVFWFPLCSRVYCAQLGQLLALDPPDCPRYCSGCTITPFEYAH